MLDSALRLCNCCFVASSVLAISITSSSVSVSSLWISFDCTRSEFVPNMRVSSMCSLVSVYLHSRAKMRTVFIYVSTLSQLSCFIDLNLNLAILKLLFGATYFSNRSHYADNVFDSMSDKSQVLETSMPSSPDHKSKYFTLTASGKRTIKHELAYCFEFLKCLRHICRHPVQFRRRQPSHFCHDATQNFTR